MLSVLTGVIGVAGIYQVGFLMFGRTAGLMAAFFLTLSDHHIDLSQDVRHYSQLATFIVLSTWYYFRLIKHPTPRRATRVGYVLTSVVLLYSHYLGGYGLICQLIHMLIFVRPWKRLRWGIFHFWAICFAFLPWSLIVIRQNQVRWETPLYYLNSLPNSYETYIMVRDALFGKQYALTLVLLILGLGWITYQTTKIQWQLRPTNSTIFLLLWLIGYISMTYYLNSNEDRQFLTIRNFIVVTPAIALLVGHGLANLQTGVRVFMVGILLILSVTTVDSRQLKPPWREVVQKVATYHNDSEPVLMDIWVGDFPSRYYIEQQIGQNTPWLSIREARDEYITQFLPIILTYIRDVESFWVIYWKSQPIDEVDYADIFRQANFQHTASFYTEHAGDRIYSHRYDKFVETNIGTYYSPDETPLIDLKNYFVNETDDKVTIQLLWSTREDIGLDYSISIGLFNETARSNIDNQPQSGNAPTSTWEVEKLVFDQHEIVKDLPSGVYQLGVKVYYYQMPETPLQTCLDGDCDWLILREVVIE